jgi:hypothetical protein
LELYNRKQIKKRVETLLRKGNAVKKILLLGATGILISLGTPALAQEKSIEEMLMLDTAKTVELIIPAPGEVAAWGRALDVIPEVTLEKDLLLYEYSIKDQDKGAIYLGRTLSILLLGIETLDESNILILFIKLKAGMQALEIDSQYVDQFNNLYLQFRDKVINRQDLTNQLDVAYANLTSKSDQKTSLTYHILQGAAWVQGQNLLAMAMKKDGDYLYAKLLLDRPDVVSLIQQRLNNAKKKQLSAPEKIDPLIDALEHYRKLTKPDTLGESEVVDVIHDTDIFLRKHE